MAFYRKLVKMSPGARNHLQTVCILRLSLRRPIPSTGYHCCRPRRGVALMPEQSPIPLYASRYDDVAA
jgi:hypothetical protein